MSVEEREMRLIDANPSAPEPDVEHPIAFVTACSDLLRPADSRLAIEEHSSTVISGGRLEIDKGFGFIAQRNPSSHWTLETGHFLMERILCRTS